MGAFESGANIQFSIAAIDYDFDDITVSGAGQNGTCSGTLTATPSDAGETLMVFHVIDSVSVQVAGTGLWVPTGIDAFIKDKGICGANAPSAAGFFVRTSDPADALPGFDRAPFVQPQIINDLSTWVSDGGDQLVSIKLTASQGSNRYCCAFKVEPGSNGGSPIVSMGEGDSDNGSNDDSGGTSNGDSSSTNNDDTDGEERFFYQLVGVMTNGMHVLKTSEYSTQESASYDTLMLVSFRWDNGVEFDWTASAIETGASRLLLFKHREIVMREHWGGEAKVDGNRIFIGPDLAGFPDSREGNGAWFTDQASPPLAR